MTQAFDIIHEDNHLLIVIKKSGVPSQGDQTGDLCLTDYAKEYLKEKYAKPGNVFVGLVHRIDRPVSGMVVLAKTSKALERMNKLFQDRALEKNYVAIVKRENIAESAVLKHWLTRDANKNKTFASLVKKADAQSAELSYEVLEHIDNYSLLLIKPVTGRQHQIRVQMQANKTPIKGDLKYGSPRSNADGSICLHAYQLKFEHPVTKEMMTFTAPPPESDLWYKFHYFNKQSK